MMGALIDDATSLQTGKPIETSLSFDVIHLCKAGNQYFDDFWFNLYVGTLPETADQLCQSPLSAKL